MDAFRTLSARLRLHNARLGSLSTKLGALGTRLEPLRAKLGRPTAPRQGCGTCFATLDPADDLPGRREVVRCNDCGRLFHAACWLAAGHCAACGGSAFWPEPVPAPTPLRVVKRKPLRSASSGLVMTFAPTEDDPEHFNEGSPFDQEVVERLARAFLLAGILLAFATLLSVFAYRLTHPVPDDARMALTLLFQQRLPANLVFGVALLSGLAVVVAWYPRPAANQPRIDPLTRWLGVLVAMLLIDLALFGPYVQPSLVQYWSTPFIQEALYAQLACVVLTLLLAPVHRRLAPLPSVTPLGSVLPFSHRGLSWLRLIATSLAIDCLAVFIVSQYVGQFSQIVSSFPVLNSLRLLAVSAFLAGLAVSALAYWPPRFRQLPALGAVRLLLFIASLALWIVVVRASSAAEAYFLAALLASTLIVVAVPLQRSLS